MQADAPPELILSAPTEAGLADAAADLPDDRLPAQVREIAEYCAHELARAEAGLTEAERRRLGVRLAARLTDELGGTSYYWPKGDAITRAVRDLTIWAEHDGTVDGPRGIKALARRYHITDVYVWRIVSRERDRHIARVQGRLPLG